LLSNSCVMPIFLPKIPFTAIFFSPHHARRLRRAL
jgi:hypothetical protein